MLCGTCGGSGTVETYRAAGSGIDGIRYEIEGQPVDIIPEPCPSCAGSGVVPSPEAVEAAAKTRRDRGAGYLERSAAPLLGCSVYQRSNDGCKDD